MRRIVTDSVDDLAPALAGLGRARLLCIYGGDGTIQRILDRLNPDDEIRMALLGGGTMNVTSRWCGLNRKPVRNFRQIVGDYQTGNLLFKEVPLLEVESGGQRHRGFTFAIGPLVRLYALYESGRKGKLAALETAALSLMAVWTRFPAAHRALIEPMPARVAIDGSVLSYDQFTTVLANTTGQINPGVEPFAGQRSRDTFYTAAYSVSPREFAAALPLLARGWLPPNVLALLRPTTFKGAAEAFPAVSLPADPRYTNTTAKTLEITTSEEYYTIDGELLPVRGPLRITLGAVVKLAVSPRLRQIAQVLRPV